MTENYERGVKLNIIRPLTERKRQTSKKEKERIDTTWTNKMTDAVNNIPKLKHTEFFGAGYKHFIHVAFSTRQ